MKVSKLLLAVACLVMVVVSTQAKVRHGGKVAGDTLLVIPKTSIAPAIDGKVDRIWNMVDATWMNYLIPSNPDDYPSSWSDLSGWCKLMYDDNNIYGLFYVQDDVIDSTTTTDWQMDGVEFYIDANHTHTATNTVSDNGTPVSGSTAYQFALRLAQKVDSAETAFGHGLKYRWFLDTASINNGGPSGYFLQFQFPLDSLGFTTPIVPNTEVSLQLQLDDNDLTSEGRTHVMNWWPSFGNSDYQQTVGWGNAIFDGTAIDTNFAFLKTTTAPVIDGNLDAIWDNANQVTMDYYLDQTKNNVLSNTDPANQDWRFYGLYDDNNIYGLFTVYDDVIDTTTTTDWQMDGAEFYIDASHTHTATNTVSDNGTPVSGSNAYQFALRVAQKIDSAEAAFGHSLKYKWTWHPGNGNDTNFATSRNYYRLEFMLNLDSLGFTTTAQGTLFSLQLQGDDNDLTSAGRTGVSPWWPSFGNSDYQQTVGWGNGKLGGSVQVGVKEKSQSVKTFRLEQNFPNPFNPTTEIRYSVAQNGFVTLKVYNVLGQEIATLFSGVRTAGQEYAATLDGSRLASGVYFYKLEAGNQMIVKKLMLLK